MQLNNIAVDKNLMETDVHGTRDFPIKIYTNDFNFFDLKYVNLHWHKEIEFVLNIKEEVDYFIGSKNIRLKPGDGILINSNVMHMAKPVHNDRLPLSYVIVMDPIFWAGSQHNLIYSKYVMPFSADNSIPFIKFRKTEDASDWQTKVFSKAEEMYHLGYECPYGYELMLHNLSGSIFFEIVLNMQPGNTGKINVSSMLMQQRMKLMLNYIYTNYMDRIQIKDIASSASLSESECYRCFKQCLNTTPVNYLIEYRIEVSLNMLTSTDMPLSDICTQCGFDSQSYFTKIFKRKIQKTPLSFRKTKLLENQNK